MSVETLEMRQVQQKFVRHAPRHFSRDDIDKAVAWLKRYVARHSEGHGFAYQIEKPAVFYEPMHQQWELYVHLVYAYLDREGEWPAPLGVPALARSPEY